MKKSGVLISILTLFLINFVSAQFFSGYNYGFSFDWGTLVPVALFAIMAVLVALPLSRIGLFQDAYGKPRGAILAVISFSVAFLSVYGIYQSGFDLDSFFFQFGGVSYPVLIAILVLGFILLVWLIKLGRTLTIIGLGLIALAWFTDIFFEDGTIMFIGIVLTVIGAILWWKRSRRTMPGQQSSSNVGFFLPLIIGCFIGSFLGIVLGRAFIAAAIGAIAGAIVILILWWLFIKRSSGTLPSSPQRNIPRTGWLKNRKIRKAEEEAYKEKAQRESQARRIWADRSKKLQKAYDRQKVVWGNTSLPFPARQAAAHEMQRIIDQANREGLHLRP